MAKIVDIDPAELEAWVAERPPIIRQLVEKRPPGLLYRLLSSGHRCTIYSYCEDGTLTVQVTGDYNRVAFERQVFGVLPENLEECDLPPADEPVGSLDIDPTTPEARAVIDRLLREAREREKNSC